MLIKGLMAGQMSGSVASVTASRNRFGPYFRNRALPVNPQSAQQVAVRGLFTMYSQMWGGVLTQAQRDSWNLYASNVPVINPLGDSIFLTGQNWYIAANVPRAQADPTNLPALTTAPAIFDRGTFTPPTVVSITAATGILSLAFTAADAWVSEDDAALLVRLSRPQSPTIDFFKGPYRYAGAVLGDMTTPLTSPQPITLPFTIVAGQALHGTAVVTRGDGRLGVPVTFRGVAA